MIVVFGSESIVLCPGIDILASGIDILCPGIDILASEINILASGIDFLASEINILRSESIVLDSGIKRRAVARLYVRLEIFDLKNDR